MEDKNNILLLIGNYPVSMARMSKVSGRKW